MNLFTAGSTAPATPATIRPWTGEPTSIAFENAPAAPATAKDVAPRTFIGPAEAGGELLVAWLNTLPMTAAAKPRKAFSKTPPPNAAETPPVTQAPSPPRMLGLSHFPFKSFEKTVPTR